ncbi:hypothetical protein BGZ50_002921 [Haplosporangium sp. Z 11]|nr:hypothetical protein BGZ50_002921 [Haplosporangium sp. Z 11]
MFPRSERFVEKIDITPGPNHYDVKLSDDDPYKRFGFLGKTKRFTESRREQGPGPYSGSNGTGGGVPGCKVGPYERSSLSTSLPSLVIDDDAASVHSNGSTTPDYTRRPSVTVRSKSSDKLGGAFTANSHRTEERLKKQLAELTEKFEKYRISHQRDLDVISEKQKKGEAMYQGAIKEKNSIMTQLAAKESEIAELGARHTMLKASLEKSERAAASVTEKIGKHAQLQKRIDELERLLARTKQSIDEHDSVTAGIRQKYDQERQALEQQMEQQSQASEAEVSQLKEQQRVTEERFEQELSRAKEDSEDWKAKCEELERKIRELELQLEEERRTVQELRSQLKREQEELQGQINCAQEKVQNLERESAEMASTSEATAQRLKSERDDLSQQLQTSRLEFATLTGKHQAIEKILEEQRVRHSEAVESMAQQHEEQKSALAKEQQKHARMRGELEQSIAHLINELGQNRDALLKVQRERSQLQEEFEQSQQELQRLSETMTALQEQYGHLQESSRQEHQSWVEKYEVLSQESSSQRSRFEGTIAKVEAELKVKNDELEQAIARIEVFQLELKTVEAEKEEAIASRAEEEKNVATAMEAVSKLEQEMVTVSEQLMEQKKISGSWETKHEELQGEVQSQDIANRSLQSELEQVMKERSDLEVQCRERTLELEDLQLVAEKQVETIRNNEQVWESERTELVQKTEDQKTTIESLQSELETMTNERKVESRVSAERISDLEARCRAMENAFKEMFEISGSMLETNSNMTTDDVWQRHSKAAFDALSHHTNECCSISKDEHTALVEEKSVLEHSLSELTATMKELESTSKNTHGDHSDLSAKVEELEDQIRQLTTQVALLEAENIGKVAIIKALQDEYEYQEKVIRELSKHEDAAKEVQKLEEDLRVMTEHAQETEVWIKQVQEDVTKYRAAYVKADVAREETLLDMVKLHEELAESEQARLQAENQLQIEVGVLIKKHELTSEELARLSKMNVDSAQNMNLKNKIKQVAQLKEENLALKKKNIGLSNTRDTLRLKCLQVERELEAYKAASATSSASSASSSASPATSTTGRSDCSGICVQAKAKVNVNYLDEISRHNLYKNNQQQ